jgi:hypothetical protein
MSGPREHDDMSLDRGVEDDEWHERYFGYALSAKSHELYDYPAADDLEDLDDEEGLDA